MTRSQQIRITGDHRWSWLAIVGSGLVFLALTVMALTIGGESWDPAGSDGWMDLPVVGLQPRLLVALVGAMLFLALTPFLLRAFRLWRDLHAGEVQVDEGIIEKRRGRETMSDFLSDFSYETLDLYVSGNRYRVPSRVYDAAPAGGAVRLYVLPRSHAVVNLEHLTPEASQHDSPMGIG